MADGGEVAVTGAAQAAENGAPAEQVGKKSTYFN